MKIPNAAMPKVLAAMPLGMMLALAACAPDPAAQAGVNPQTGLAACRSRDGLLWANGGNRPVQSANSLPAGAKDGSSSCIAQNTSHPYAAP